MLKSEPIRVHPNLSETFSFGEKMQVTPIKRELSTSQMKELIFRNKLIAKKKDIYPIYKIYYHKYKKALSSATFGNSRDNLFDFLSVIACSDKNGKMFYLEDLYKRRNIVPATFSSLLSLFEEIDYATAFSISMFLKQKKQEEIKSFNILSSFMNESGRTYSDGHTFLIATEEEINKVLYMAFSKHSDYYLQILEKKAVDSKIRSSLFDIFYTLKIPFSSTDLLFFLSSSHLQDKKLETILGYFGISRKQFDDVFTMSLCMNPSLKDIYDVALEKENVKKEDVSFYPSSLEMEKMQRKLEQSNIDKKKVYL